MYMYCPSKETFNQVPPSFCNVYLQSYVDIALSYYVAAHSSPHNTLCITTGPDRCVFMLCGMLGIEGSDALEDAIIKSPG